jgi:hypothetical protein
VADVSKPTMALFANIILDNVKKGNNTMFVMISRFPGMSGPLSRPMFRGSICLCPDVVFDVVDHPH